MSWLMFLLIGGALIFLLLIGAIAAVIQLHRLEVQYRQRERDE